MQIRRATAADWDLLWPIVRAVVDAGETYVWSPTPAKDEMKQLWLEPDPWYVVLATDEDGTVLGTAKCGPNRPGRGSHVATASFMVAPEAQGRGVGRTLAEHVLGWAREAGYHGMQFNAVVESNTAAVALWESLGFERVGTVPDAFDHPREGLVGLIVMYRALG